MAPLEITVTGTSKIYHQAERAIMTIRVTNSASSQEEASNSVTRTAAHLQSLLRPLAPVLPTGIATPDAPITHWTMKTLSTSHYARNDSQVYSATTHFEIKFRDFATLNSLTSTLSTTPHVVIDNVHWAVTEVTKKSLETQSRQLAVAHAQQKARDFAEAFGARSEDVRPTHLTDGRSMGVASAHGNVRPSKARMMVMQGDGEGDATWSFASEEIQLSGNVTVKFEVQLPGTEGEMRKERKGEEGGVDL